MTLVCLVENRYSERQFSTAVVDANEEAAGRQAWHVATGRRASDDYWTPTTANLLAWVRVDAGSSVSCDAVALDRGHNLEGETIQVRKSTDNFAANNVLVFAATIPATAADSDVSATNGATTPEGAWIKTFTADSSRYWRVDILAMGAGLKPTIVGLWLGTSWQPSILRRDTRTRDAQLVAQSAKSPVGWMGRTQTVRQRRGVLRVHLANNAAAVTDAETHIEGHYDLGRPMWIVEDDTKGERAVLGVRPDGVSGFAFGDRRFMEADIAWEEWEPKVDL